MIKMKYLVLVSLIAVAWVVFKVNWRIFQHQYQSLKAYLLMMKLHQRNFQSLSQNLMYKNQSLKEYLANNMESNQ